MSKISDMVKHVMYEDEDIGQKPKVSPSTPPSSPSTSSSWTQVNTAIPSPEIGLSLDDEVSKINFDVTPAGRVIQRYYAGLDGSGLDPSAQFKAAVKQASKLDGITLEQILKTFDDLKASLHTVSDKLDSEFDKRSQSDIGSRQQRLKSIGDQINQLSQQLTSLQTASSQLLTEINTARGNIVNDKTRVLSAIAKRNQEIDYQKSQLLSLFGK